jgi:hypothetical protein
MAGLSWRLRSLGGFVAGVVMAGLCIRLALALDAPLWAVGAVAIAFGGTAVVLGFWPSIARWAGWRSGEAVPALVGSAWAQPQRSERPRRQGVRGPAWQKP